VEWARSLVEDPVLRRAFGDGVIDAVEKGAIGDAGGTAD
jgi:hypothetical protein